MLDSKNILFIGTPATGKTSFLAALYNYVYSDLPNKNWHQYREPSNAEYINKIHNRWLRCEEQSRTIQEQETYNQVELYLESTVTGQRVTIEVPDIAGEAFAQQWSSRFWSETYQRVVEGSSGILFFVHPERVKSPVLLTGTQELLGDFFSPELEEHVAWNHDLSPTQVILVELLQFHKDFIYESPIPIAIVISAWDTVLNASEDITPENWLSINLPLLSQFIQSNPELLSVTVFGVSAVGGDIKKQERQSELREMDEPANRVKVQQGTTQNHDISAPVQWIIDKWREKQN